MATDTEKVKAGKEVIRGLNSLDKLLPGWLKSIILVLTVFAGAGGGAQLLGPDVAPALAEIKTQLVEIREDSSDTRERLIRLEVEVENLKKAK